MDLGGVGGARKRLEHRGHGLGGPRLLQRHGNLCRINLDASGRLERSESSRKIRQDADDAVDAARGDVASRGVADRDARVIRPQLALEVLQRPFSDAEALNVRVHGFPPVGTVDVCAENSTETRKINL